MIKFQSFLNAILKCGFFDLIKNHTNLVKTRHTKTVKKRSEFCFFDYLRMSEAREKMAIYIKSYKLILIDFKIFLGKN